MSVDISRGFLPGDLGEMAGSPIADAPSAGSDAGAPSSPIDLIAPPAGDELAQLRYELAREKKRREAAERAMAALREESARTAMALEEEEENITNKLMKRLTELKREKERMARQSESEEEFLTNTLQIRLEELQRQKHSIIASAEAEQEFIVNKLQRQLDELKVEKSALERKVQRLSRPGTPHGTGTPGSSPATSLRSNDGITLSRGNSLTGSVAFASGGHPP